MFNGLEFDQAKMGLVNFLGQLASMAEDQGDKQQIVAMLLEQAFILSKNDKDNLHDLYRLKPLYRSVIALNKERINILTEAPETEEVKKQIDQYSLINNNISELLDRI